MTQVHILELACCFELLNGLRYVDLCIVHPALPLVLPDRNPTQRMIVRIDRLPLKMRPTALLALPYDIITTPKIKAKTW